MVKQKKEQNIAMLDSDKKEAQLQFARPEISSFASQDRHAANVFLCVISRH